jgi:hypothetical protein
MLADDRTRALDSWMLAPGEKLHAGAASSTAANADADRRPMEMICADPRRLEEEEPQ